MILNSAASGRVSPDMMRKPIKANPAATTLATINRTYPSNSDDKYAVIENSTSRRVGRNYGSNPHQFVVHFFLPRQRSNLLKRDRADGKDMVGGEPLRHLTRLVVRCSPRRVLDRRSKSEYSTA